jgi:predicted porin
MTALQICDPFTTSTTAENTMKKKLISMAVAAAMVAPAAAMAEAILYGKLHVSIDYADVKNVIGREDFKGWGVNATGEYMPGAGRAQRIGVKGSEDLGNGLKAIYQVELGLAFGASDDNIPGNNNNSFNVRNSFVGLAGGFGSVLVGRHDTPFKISTGKLDMFADTMADYNGTVGFDDLRVDNAIAYISPSFSGFQFMGALVAPGGATAYGDENINSDQLNGAWSLAGIYSNGPFFASLAYENLSNEMFMDSAWSENGRCYNASGIPNAVDCYHAEDDYTKWRVGLGLLDWNGFTLSGVYESQDNRPFSSDWTSGVRDNWEGEELWQIQAGYAFGNNQVKAMYGAADRDDIKAYNTRTNSWESAGAPGDKNTWAIAFDHNFSKRTKAYVLYTAVDDDARRLIPGSEWSGFSMGMIHSF